MTDDIRRLVKAPEAARILGISARTLFTYTKNLGLPCIRINRVGTPTRHGSVFYDTDDLWAWVAARKEGSREGVR